MDNDSGAEEETINGDVIDNQRDNLADENEGSKRKPGEGRIVELLQEEREGTLTSQPLGNGTNRYRNTGALESPSEDGSLDAIPHRPASPRESLLSIPDDSPSVQVW